MNFIDTHCHLYSAEFDADRTAALESALKAGLSHIFLPAIDSETHEKVIELEAAHPEHCFAMMGLHPCSVGDDPAVELALVEKYWAERDFVAVGEIGIDLYWRQDNLQKQVYAFERQIDLALKKNRPIVIHCRDAFDPIFESLEKYRGSGLKGIFHCFTGNHEQAIHAIGLGLLLGIGGVLTYRKSGLADVLYQIPLSHMVLETDAPYLPPVPHRGKRNEPAYLVHVAEKLSEVTGAPVSRIAELTSRNALNLFLPNER